ncbi:MAG: DUF4870 domain-containing protein [Anaerolineae bacterium]
MSVEEMNPEESMGQPPEEIIPAESMPEAKMETEQSPAVEGMQPPEVPTQPATTWPAKDVTDNDRLMAALAYATQVLIPVIVPVVMLLTEESKKRPFQRFHAIQSLGFLAASVVYEILAAIVFTVLTIVSAGCLGCILWVLFFVPIVPALYYAYQAYKGLYFKIPFLTDFMVNSKWLEIPAE